MFEDINNWKKWVFTRNTSVGNNISQKKKSLLTASLNQNLIDTLKS